MATPAASNRRERNADATPTLAAAPYASDPEIPVSAGRRRARWPPGVRAAAPSHRRQRRDRSPAARRHERQPNAAMRYGIRWIVRSVNVNPSAVCSVSMVPTQARSDNSAIDAENCAESATMLTPQTMQSATSQPGRRRTGVRRRGAAPAHRHRHDGDRRAPETIRQEAGADRADRPGRDGRERRELGRCRRLVRRQRQREARIKKTPIHAHMA